MLTQSGAVVLKALVHLMIDVLGKGTFSCYFLFPPIFGVQIQSAPSVNTPELKESPHDPTDIEFSTSKSFEPLSLDEIKKEADGSTSSPHSGPKFAFGFGRKSSLVSSSSCVASEKKAKLETVFNPDEDEGLGSKPKIKLVPIEYTEEEQQAVGRTNKIPKEEKNKMVQNLVNSIPTAKEELFAYELKWETIDKVSMHPLSSTCAFVFVVYSCIVVYTASSGH